MFLGGIYCFNNLNSNKQTNKTQGLLMLVKLLEDTIAQHFKLTMSGRCGERENFTRNRGKLLYSRVFCLYSAVM